MSDHQKEFAHDMELIKGHFDRLAGAIGTGVETLPQKELVDDIAFLLKYTMGKAIAVVDEYVTQNTPPKEKLKVC